MSVPKLLILPRKSSQDAKILTLAHPRTSKPCRYYFDPSQGIFEFTRVAAPKAACRSWLLKRQQSFPLRSEGQQEQAATGEPEPRKIQDDYCSSSEDDTRDNSTSRDYIAKDAEILVATPIDPLFVLLPTLFGRKLFVSVDDLLDGLSERSKHFSLIYRNRRIREQMEARLNAICDIVDAGDEHMYRLNEGRLSAELLHKAEKIVASGLPASMEERFVKRILEEPLAIVKREESFASMNGTETPQSEEMTAESVESQPSTATVESQCSLVSVATDITVPEDRMDDVKNLHHLLRVRTALTYIVDSYIPNPLALSLTGILASDNSPIDLKPLEKRLAEIARLKAEALAARSLGDFSRKRNMYDEDDLVEGRLEKKKRLDEEEKKRKASETRGIRDLKKVNTKGMKKMSDFFGKRTSPRKKK